MFSVIKEKKAILPPEIVRPLERSWTEAEAFAYCTRLTKSHYENFPVGSVLMPARLQSAVHSLYAFMRTADDFSDENRHAGDEQERLGWIQAWDAMLSDCEKGKAEHPVFIALRSTLSKFDLPAVWLHDLLHAFSMDCTVRRYATHQDLIDYCRYSANPVGRLILTLFGYRDEELYRLSDGICTGLQLANHWQDVAVDLAKDRIYLPQDTWRRFEIAEAELLKGQASPAFKLALAYEVVRAREYFELGKSLPEHVQGRLKWELRLTWQGGVRILDKIEKADYDVFTRRPVVTKADWFGITFATLFSHG